MLYAFYWVNPRRLDFICRRFGTLFRLNREVGMKNTPTFLNILHIYLTMKMEQPDCSETWAYKFQTPENYPEESIQLFTNQDGVTLQNNSVVIIIVQP